MTGAARLLGPGAVALLVAAAANSALSLVRVEHDALLVTLLAVATVAAGGLALRAAESAGPSPWSRPATAERPDSGEDTRTTTLRRLVEVHLASREADDAVVWQLADLAALRLRQDHGLRHADDPERVRELLGPLLADWVAVDRRERHHRTGRPVRYTPEQLAAVLDRIEAL